MKLEKLYSTRSDKNIQEWEIEVKDNMYRVTSGMESGQKVTAEWTVCSGKNIGRSNETTPEEQALAEAKAIWQKKVDKGYRASKEELSKVTLFEPMLAKKYEDYKDSLKFPLYSQPKLNGMRCLASVVGLKSRGGKDIVSCPHIFEALKPTLEANPSIHLDGELYNHKLGHELNEIMHLVKQPKPTKEEFKNSAEKIKYYVYDMYDSDNPDMKFSDRIAIAENLIKGIECVVIVETSVVNSLKEIDSLYRTYLKDEYEGQILRIDKEYQNKRSNYLLKHKSFQDEEFEIVDFVPGNGNRTGTIGAVVCKLPSGETFNSNIRGSRELLSELYKDKNKYIGKLATVKFFEKTPYGVPLYPYVIMMDRESIE